MFYKDAKKHAVVCARLPVCAEFPYF